MTSCKKTSCKKKFLDIMTDTGEKRFSRKRTRGLEMIAMVMVIILMTANMKGSLCHARRHSFASTPSQNVFLTESRTQQQQRSATIVKNLDPNTMTCGADTGRHILSRRSMREESGCQRHIRLHECLSVRGGGCDASFDVEYEDESEVESKEDEETSDEEEEEEIDFSSETEEEEEDSYEEEGYEAEEEMGDNIAADDNLVQTVKSKSSPSAVEAVEYDEPLFMSPMNGLMVQLGVMMLCRRINLDDPKVILAAR
jgi:hypothetical protein